MHTRFSPQRDPRDPRYSRRFLWTLYFLAVIALTVIFTAPMPR